MNRVAENNKRIARNTLFLYFRMVLVMGVTLYTSRVILKSLGIEGFGLFGVIAGIVSLFSVISGSLSSAISRFITFELGKDNPKKLRKVFESSFAIQLLMAISIIVIFVPAGVWFIRLKMNIPIDDYSSAYWVYGFSVATFCINLLSVPYNASIISHENMAVFSYVSILEVTLKLGVAYLIKIMPSNRLIIYAALLLGVAILIQGVYWIYCRTLFPECRIGLRIDKGLLKDIGSFAGWNFIGTASNVLRNQGNNILLNIFFGTVVNAAYTICMQVNSAVSQFADNFMVSVNPQITKYYARGERSEMNLLITRSARLSFYLCWLLGIVILTQTKYILHLWLGEVPPQASLFVQLIIVFTLSESISKPLITAMLATGRIKTYQLIVGGIQMLNLPLSYIVLKVGGASFFPLAISILLSQACFIARLFLLRNMINLDVASFLKQVYIRCIFVVLFSLLLPLALLYIKLVSDSFLGFITRGIMDLFWVSLIITFIGLTATERVYLKHKIISISLRIKG